MKGAREGVGVQDDAGQPELWPASTASTLMCSREGSCVLWHETRCCALQCKRNAARDRDLRDGDTKGSLGLDIGAGPPGILEELLGRGSVGRIETKAPFRQLRRSMNRGVAQCLVIGQRATNRVRVSRRSGFEHACAPYAPQSAREDALKDGRRMGLTRGVEVVERSVADVQLIGLEAFAGEARHLPQMARDLVELVFGIGFVLEQPLSDQDLEDLRSH